MSDVCTTMYVVMFNLIRYTYWFQRQVYDKKCQSQVYIHELIYQMSDLGLIRQMLNLGRNVTESNS